MNENAPLSDYLVISRGQWDSHLSPDEIQRAIDAFYAWHARLVDEGKMTAGQRLKSDCRLVSKQRIVDGPYTEAKEIVGGFWFIHATTLDAAAELAAQNPCLACGLLFEIRPIDPERASAFIDSNETPRR